MQQTWRVTDADRDDAGNIRTLADLLPTAPQEDEAPPARVAWRPGRMEIAGIVGGLLLATILIAGLNTFWPASAPRALPTADVAATADVTATIAPTPAQQAAYASPGGALLGGVPLTTTIAYQHSAWPGWAGVAWQGAIVWVETDAPIAQLPDLAPLPTAAPRPLTLPAPAPAAAPALPACDPTVNPAYVVKIAVLGPHSEPLGSATGVSCTSQAEAQSNADALADGVRANVATADAADEKEPTIRAR